MKDRSIAILAIVLLFLYIGSYAWFYSHRGPAANLAYFVYLEDGGEKQERFLYYLYYPVYKIHTHFGSGHHNWDRPSPKYSGL
jgi:hypothetical protein